MILQIPFYLFIYSCTPYYYSKHLNTLSEIVIFIIDFKILEKIYFDRLKINYIWIFFIFYLSIFYVYFLNFYTLLIFLYSTLQR